MTYNIFYDRAVLLEDIYGALDEENEAKGLASLEDDYYDAVQEESEKIYEELEEELLSFFKGKLKIGRVENELNSFITHFIVNDYITWALRYDTEIGFFLYIDDDDYLNYCIDIDVDNHKELFNKLQPFLKEVSRFYPIILEE